MICILLCDGYDIDQTEAMESWLSKLSNLDSVRYIFPSSLSQFIKFIKILCIPDGNPEFIASSLRNVSNNITEYLKSGGILISCGGGSHALSLIKTHEVKLSPRYAKNYYIKKHDKIFAQSNHIFPIGESRMILNNNDLHICEWCLNHETINCSDMSYDLNTIVYLGTSNTPLCFFKFINKHSGGILHLHIFPKDHTNECIQYFDNILNDISHLAYGKYYKLAKKSKY